MRYNKRMDLKVDAGLDPDPGEKHWLTIATNVPCYFELEAAVRKAEEINLQSTFAKILFPMLPAIGIVPGFDSSDFTILCLVYDDFSSSGPFAYTGAIAFNNDRYVEMQGVGYFGDSADA